MRPVKESALRAISGDIARKHEKIKNIYEIVNVLSCLRSPRYANPIYIYVDTFNNYRRYIAESPEIDLQIETMSTTTLGIMSELLDFCESHPEHLYAEDIAALVKLIDTASASKIMPPLSPTLRDILVIRRLEME